MRDDKAMRERLRNFYPRAYDESEWTNGNVLAFAAAERERERAELVKRGSEGQAPLFAQTETWLRDTVGVHRERLAAELTRLRALVASQAAQIDELRAIARDMQRLVTAPNEAWEQPQPQNSGKDET